MGRLFNAGGIVMKTVQLRPITVTIEETVSQSFSVDAVNVLEAIEIAKQKYKSGEFILEPGEVTCRKVMADDGVVSTPWDEF